MKEQRLLEEQTTVFKLKEALQEIIHKIHTICLHPKFKGEKIYFVGLGAKCQQLIEAIDFLEEWELSFNSLPHVAREEMKIVSERLLNRLVGTYTDLQKVLNKYPIKWHKQILLVNESKLLSLINTEQKLIETLQSLKDPVL